MTIHIQDPSNSANSSDTAITWQPVYTNLTVTDFNRDGFDDIVLVSDPNIVIYSAVDPTAPAKGVQEVARFSLPAGNRNPPVTGDFNGDGALDVATVMEVDSNANQYFSASFFSVCPNATATILGQSCSAAFQIVPVKTTVPLPSNDEGQNAFLVGPPPQLIAGNFEGTGQAQLIGDSQLNNSEGTNFWHQLNGWDFASDFTPTQRFSFGSIQSGAYPDPGYGAAASLGQSQQLVYTNSSYANSLYVFTFDSSLNMKSYSTTLSPSGCYFPVGLSVMSRQ